MILRNYTYIGLRIITGIHIKCICRRINYFKTYKRMQITMNGDGLIVRKLTIHILLKSRPTFIN